MLVADLETPGVTVRSFPTLGGGSLCEVFLDGVEIPRAQLVGELHGGWEVLMHTLDFERITSEKLGGLQWVLDRVHDHLRGPAARARPRADGAATRRARRRAAALAAGGRLLDRHEPAAAASAMAKLAGARVTQHIADTACDLLGLDGLVDGDPSSPVEGRVGALYRASVGSSISGGTAEVQQLVVARRGLGL